MASNSTLDPVLEYPYMDSVDRMRIYPNIYDGGAPYPSESIYGSSIGQGNTMGIAPYREFVPSNYNGVDSTYTNLGYSSVYDEQDYFFRERLNHNPYAEDMRISRSSSSSRANLYPSSIPQSQGSSAHMGGQYPARSSMVPSNDSKKLKSKPVDLSHLYLVNTKDSVKLTQTNESVAHYSHKVISECLGEDKNAVLLPRLKALDMYRKNVKKSKDPDVMFQYAQYMLQTALTMDIAPGEGSGDEKENSKKAQQNENLKNQFLKEAKLYLTKLSVKGYKDAQYLLADAYSSGAFGKVNHKDAFPLFQSSAKHGHIEAAYRTAVCFEKGLGTTRDSRKCIEFLKFAASRNHPAAMFKLGLYSFHGRMGLPQDVNTKQNGIKWLSRAAARANELTCAAPFELAQIYENGFLDIVIPDESYATELYVQAASLGHVASTTKLGKMYEQGNEVIPQDASLSVHYYTQSALKGDPEAMLGLCAWYLVGAPPALELDDREAFQWALKAAKKGYAKAQYTVGYFHENGKGCKEDISMAYKWYECAAENNDPRAIKKIASRKASKKRSSIFFGFPFSKSDDGDKSTIELDDITEEATSDDNNNNNNNNNNTNSNSNSTTSSGDDVKIRDYKNKKTNEVDSYRPNTMSSIGSIDVLNVITEGNSPDIEFDDPTFPSYLRKSSTPTDAMYAAKDCRDQSKNQLIPMHPPPNAAHLFSSMSAYDSNYTTSQNRKEHSHVSKHSRSTSRLDPLIRGSKPRPLDNIYLRYSQEANHGYGNHGYGNRWAEPYAHNSVPSGVDGKKG
ncbi:HHL132Cp [Eremothecium sinecaudum]|uniref:HHL132Cp n=1 Tax=Eremothecium sinecaudum TaxID=45286 RepID=A0A109V0Z3_9SACH|nr:HHL132Cp [Eremothecium sinecaudum]AMD22638.1 HHL132Cp [Eremothecium sinecaudum]